MKTNTRENPAVHRCPALHVGVFALLSIINLQISAFAQGAAFTYQGRLNQNGTAVNGSCDLIFGVWTSFTGPSQIGSTLTNSNVAVSNGLFTVALDFGPGVFIGANRWLEIGARTNGGGAFVTLSPRQPITATPYSITASNLTGALSAGSDSPSK